MYDIWKIIQSYIYFIGILWYKFKKVNRAYYLNVYKRTDNIKINFFYINLLFRIIQVC